MKAMLIRTAAVLSLLTSLSLPAGAAPPPCSFEDFVEECWSQPAERSLQSLLDRAHDAGHVVTALWTPHPSTKPPAPVKLRFQRRGPKAVAVQYRVVVAGRGQERKITRRLSAAGADGFRLQPLLSPELRQPLPVLVEFARKRRILILQRPEGSQEAWEYLALETPREAGYTPKLDAKERANYERRIREAEAAGFAWCPQAPWLMERRVPRSAR